MNVSRSAAFLGSAILVGLAGVAAHAQPSNMTFFVTSVGSGRERISGAWKERTSIANGLPRPQARGAGPGAPICRRRPRAARPPSMRATASDAARGRTPRET